MANTNDKFTATFNTTNPNVARALADRASGNTVLQADNLTGWPTVSKVHFSTYRLDTGNAVVPGSQRDWTGIVSGNNIGTLVLKAGGVDDGNFINDVIEMNPTGSWAQDLYTGLTNEHDLTGKHGDITPTSITSPTGTITNLSVTSLTVGSQTPSADWTASVAPNTVTYNGNHSYSMVFNGSDLTGSINPGTRIRTTRTVAAPTQSTSLNGTTQYWVKTSPNKMTFTDDFVVSAWIKISSYGNASIVSRFNGTSGWDFRLTSTGQVQMSGFNGSSANESLVLSYQTVPLNKWVHVVGQLDMSSFTTTATTSYIMFDGIDVPCSVLRSGTNPTSLIQAGNFEVGSRNGGTLPFPGKIAQAAVFNAKVTQATMQGYISQGLLGTETSLASAYSFNGTTNDLNTTTPNNLVAGAGSPTATNTDSPFGGQANGTISSTLDYGIVQSSAFSTNTTLIVLVNSGNTIPTLGGVTSLSYSSAESPYGFPALSTPSNFVGPNAFGNSGAAGGTMYYTNIGGIKILWGQTQDLISAPSGPQFAVNFPPNFFNSIQSATVSANVINTTSIQSINWYSIGISGGTILTYSSSTTAAEKFGYMVIGT